MPSDTQSQWIQVDEGPADGAGAPAIVQAPVNLAIQWPIHFVFGAIGDYRQQVDPGTLAEVAKAAPKRQREFAAGRHFAQIAFTHQPASATSAPKVGRNGRAPEWPQGITGSISHSHKFAWAAIAANDHIRGLGIDVEAPERVKQRLYSSIFTAAEIQQQHHPEAQAVPEQWAAIAFSAKEAGYKAVNPLTDRYIGFHEAEVQPGPEAGQFRLNYVGKHAPNAIMNQGFGYYAIHAEQVLTVFVIPNQPPGPLDPA